MAKETATGKKETNIQNIVWQYILAGVKRGGLIHSKILNLSPDRCLAFYNIT